MIPSEQQYVELGKLLSALTIRYGAEAFYEVSSNGSGKIGVPEFHLLKTWGPTDKPAVVAKRAIKDVMARTDSALAAIKLLSASLTTEAELTALDTIPRALQDKGVS